MTDRITGPFQRPETSTERARTWWAWLTEPWHRSCGEFDIHLLRTVARLSDRITHLETLMATVTEIVTRLDTATNEVAADLATIKDQLTAALADVDAAKRAAVDEALAMLDAPIARLEALGADPADPVPSVEPAPEGG